VLESKDGLDGQAKLEVLEEFKGTEKPGNNLWVPSGTEEYGGLCTFAFKVGRTYLTYADRLPSNELYVSTCESHEDMSISD